MKTKLSLLVVVVLLTLSLTVGCSGNKVGIKGEEKPYVPIEERGYKNNDLLVSVDWLKGQLDRKDLLVLDARGPEAYNKGHIPGAVPTKWQDFSNMDAKRGEGFAVLLSAEDISAQLQAVGVDENKEIVVYADPNGWGEDGRIVWMLRMAGLKNSKILDGGWPAWTNADGEVSKDTVSVVSTNFSVNTLDLDMFTTTEFIRKNFDDLIIIDSRTKKEFDGATDYGEPRGGHIAGAIHLIWSEFLNMDYTIKTQEEIEAILSKAGIQKDDVIVTYCTSGIRSAHAALVLRMAGYENAMNYDASINEWGAYDELPME